MSSIDNKMTALKHSIVGGEAPRSRVTNEVGVSDEINSFKFKMYSYDEKIG